MARLQDHYNKTIVPALQKEFEYKNVMQVPHLEKIVINMGVGEAIADKNAMKGA
jgi:large subunit ribosomal protein L5